MSSIVAVVAVVAVVEFIYRNVFKLIFLKFWIFVEDKYFGRKSKFGKSKSSDNGGGQKFIGGNKRRFNEESGGGGSGGKRFKKDESSGDGNRKNKRFNTGLKSKDQIMKERNRKRKIQEFQSSRKSGGKGKRDWKPPRAGTGSGGGKKFRGRGKK